MDLHVTLAAGPGVRLPEGERTQEIVITRAQLVSGKQLHEQLAKRTGATHFFVGGTPIRELDPGVPPLTSGAVIVSSTEEHRVTRTARPGSLFFVVRSGPDAGKTVSLSRGVYTIGRSAANITINDPELSRVHAVLTVTDDALILHDRNSANGVWVDGSRGGRVPVTTCSDIRLGSSRCALVLADTPIEPAPSIDLSEPCVVSAQPPPEGSRLLILAAFLPLVLGVVLAVSTGMWFFLAFSVLSAVTGLVPLMNGRRKRRAFDAAVAEAVSRDRERRRRAAPEVGRLVLPALQPGLNVAQDHPSSLYSRGRYLRLGIADQPANVEAKPTSAGWQSPVIPGAPLLVPLHEPGEEEPLDLDVLGPQQTLIRVAHLLLLQLSTLQDAGRVVCYGPAQVLPQAARFLPRVTLVTRSECLDELLATGRYSTVVLFGAASLASGSALRVYRFSSSTSHHGGSWTVNYFPPQPVLSTPGGDIRFQPDFVRSETFDELARAYGNREHSDDVDAANPSVPEAISLSELTTCDSTSIAERWRTASVSARLGTSIGSSATGPLDLDLVTDGPHLLVAGTTGSGKSEFLRTLVLGLALNYSPADLNFLFIDFKGGSGLGRLAQLPHASGLLTDLSAAAVSRALISLTAEVKRREAIFADVGATDYLEYRDRTPAQLPRLVAVIDEFRILSDEIPGAVHELMRIATLGRSLGMHLVLATQRPQGAVTSDIRANITTNVALRMQSAVESHDVIDSTLASSIPVESPGRGYLRVASGQPTEFQTATTARRAESPATITSFAAFLAQGPGAVAPQASGKEGVGIGPFDATDNVQALVDSANTAAQAVPLPSLFEPVRPPLPTTLTRTTAVPADIPQLGLLDIPHLQDQHPLVWDPTHHSHIALIGQPGSGLRSAVSYLTAEHLRTLPDRHLYLLDGDSSLREGMSAPQVGAYVTTSEIKRAARVLQRIAELVIDRLNGGAESSAAVPLITVFITGWGRWAAAFRGGRFAWAEDALQEIVRDGEAAGIALVISGERELVAGRFYSMIPNRLYLPLGATPEALLSWPKLPAIDAVPGRAFVQGRVSAVADSVAQLIARPVPVPYLLPAQPPFAVAALPRTVSSSRLSTAALNERTIRIPIGVGGDDLAPVCLELPQRSAALVVGAAGTGKSQALDLIAHLAPPSIRRVRPASDEDPQLFWKRAAALGTDSNDLLLVDDADRLPRETHQHFPAMLTTGARAVFASVPSPLIATSPALSPLRISPLGVVLGPRSPTDGDVFGLRLDVDGMPPPGRGILVDSRRSVEIQLAQCDGVVPNRHAAD